MNIYTKKINPRIKLTYIISSILLVIALILAIIYLLMYFDIVKVFNQFETIDLYLAIGVAVLAFIILLIAFSKDKRENILYDGQSIKFRINRKVVADYPLKDIEQMMPYRSEQGIAYGMANALAFRMDKEKPWISIDNTFYKKSRREKYTRSITLIKEITLDYAKIKTQRAIKEIDDHKGVRFTYLIIKDESMNSIDVRNTYLKRFESEIINANPNKQYSGYGDFVPNSLTITRDSLYINKVLVATIKENDFIKIRSKFNKAVNEFYSYDIVDFYNKKGKLILSIDLALVINSEFFKSMLRSVFHEELDSNI